MQLSAIAWILLATTDLNSTIFLPYRPPIPRVSGELPVELFVAEFLPSLHVELVHSWPKQSRVEIQRVYMYVNLLVRVDVTVHLNCTGLFALLLLLLFLSLLLATVDPPAPVICPIGGRYSFIQIGDQWEKYYTRIRGITERPRHKIDCHEYISEFKSCDDNPRKLYIDAEYCNSVDHNAKPISEYGWFVLIIKKMNK